MKRFGATVLVFKDPDGMRLALVAVPRSADEPAWNSSGIPVEFLSRLFDGVLRLSKHISQGQAIGIDDAIPTGDWLKSPWARKAARAHRSTISDAMMGRNGAGVAGR